MIISSSSTATTNPAIFRLRILLLFQRFSHIVPAVEGKTKRCSDAGHGQKPGSVVSSSWASIDARKIGIKRNSIPPPPTTVIKVLKEQGFDAYLVGGCVRDLLLHRIPKDYDVITTANLSKVRGIFRRALIVGKKFPICLVHMKGSVVEVSSFETAGKEAKIKGKFVPPQMLRGHDEKDVLRWTDCMRRDFTVNGLFFNPLTDRIYDYTNALSDLRSSKLRTLIPAQKSFEEDCARILRGLRLAARLNFSFTEAIENAIYSLGPSIQTLSKSRILGELDYMFLYGAAEPSLELLHRFRLLDFLLPIQAAYLSQQASTTSGNNSPMLLKLLANLDLLVSCDRPAHGCLWVSLFAFHQALVINPQQPLVVMAFASVLHHDNWKKGVQFAREHAESLHMYVPEISNCVDSISNDKLVKELRKFGALLQDSVDALTGSESLQKSLAKFPESASSSLNVFVSKKMGKDANQIFQIGQNSLDTRKKNEEIDYDLLGKGDINEVRFVLGKIIMNTLLKPGFVQEDMIKQEEGILPPTKKDRSTKKQLTESEDEQKVPEMKKISKDNMNEQEKDRDPSTKKDRSTKKQLTESAQEQKVPEKKKIYKDDMIKKVKDILVSMKKDISTKKQLTESEHEQKVPEKKISKDNMIEQEKDKHPSMKKDRSTEKQPTECEHEHKAPEKTKKKKKKKSEDDMIKQEKDKHASTKKDSSTKKQLTESEHEQKVPEKKKNLSKDDMIKQPKDKHPSTKKDSSTNNQLTESEHEQQVQEKKKKKKKSNSKKKKSVNNDNSCSEIDGGGVGIGCVLEKQHNAKNTQENIEEIHHLPIDSSSSCLEQLHVVAGGSGKVDESKEISKEKNENKIVQKNRLVKLSQLF